MSILRSHMTFCAHLFKALTKQHHTELMPLFVKYVPKDGVVFDVGAHAGQFTKLFSRLVPHGNVYAFEPGKYPLSIVKKVKALRRLNNVTIIPFGLSDVKSEASLNTPIKKSGSMGFGLSSLGVLDDKRKIKSETVALTTIDYFVQENDIERIDLLKADIEGWELRMLWGAQKALEKFRPILILEVCEKFLARAGNTRNELLNFLATQNYNIYEHDDDGKISPISEQSQAFFCVPIERKQPIQNIQTLNSRAQ